MLPSIKEASPPVSLSKRCTIPETYLAVDFVRSKEVFVLEVRGNSMQDEHILDGDFSVLVEKVPTAHNGDIVVALVEGHPTQPLNASSTKAITSVFSLPM